MHVDVPAALNKDDFGGMKFYILGKTSAILIKYATFEGFFHVFLFKKICLESILFRSE